MLFLHAQKVDKSSIEARKCFLCPENKPNEQDEIIISLDEPFSLRINPYPILPGHLTISSLKHQDQVLADKTIRQLPGKLISWLEEYFASGYVLFYNGAKCGASAPDHFHFQAVKQSDVPVIQQWERLMETAVRETEIKTENGNTYSSFQITSYICPIQVFICNHSTDILPEMINQYLESLPLHEGEKRTQIQFICMAGQTKRVHDGLFSTRRTSPGLLYGNKRRATVSQPWST